MDSLPAELIALILLELHWKDVIRCKMISKGFKELIENTVSLQYHIELGISHMIERPRYAATSTAARQHDQESEESSTSSVADKLAELRRIQTAWDFPILPNIATKVSCDQFWPAYDLQGGVLSLGVSLGAPRTSQAMRFFKLPSYGQTQDDLVTWGWEDIGLPVRDFTTDPRMDFIALVERESTIFVDPQDGVEQITQYADVKARHIVHFRTMTSSSPHPKCCPTKTSVTFELDLDPGETISTSVLASVRGPLFGFLVRQEASEFGGGYCTLWIWDWVRGERVLMRHNIGSVSFEFLTDDSILLYSAGFGANHFESHQWKLEVHQIVYDGASSPDAPYNVLTPAQENKRKPVVFMLPSLATDRMVQIPHIRCRIGPNSTALSPSSTDLYKGGVLEDGKKIWDPKWPFEPDPDDRLVSILASLYCGFPPIGQVEDDFSQVTIIAAFMHSQMLVQVAQERRAELMDIGSMHPGLTIQWEEWGPKNVRMIEGLSLNALVCDTDGMRYIRHGELRMENPPIEDTSYGPVMFIMDFDPYTPSSIASKRRSQERNRWGKETEHGGEKKMEPHSRVINKPTTLRFPSFFQNEIVTELPYCETALRDPTGLPHTSMIMDDARIILFRVSDLRLRR
ncbi:hypothetical protein FRC02_006041 [Tulasnella sp. 418]|nr:hypothetical protein FRC02_006041 [Tulasnella sp. 418]